MERIVLEDSWRRNGPVGPSLEVIDDDYDDDHDDDDTYFMHADMYRIIF
jgi:hypothetical protein